MQERIFFEFLKVYLKEKPSAQSLNLLKGYIQGVPALALSRDIFALILNHEIGKENVAGQS